VQYELDDQKLTRKVAVRDEFSEPYEKRVSTEASGQSTSLSVKVRIEGSHVRITNDKGEFLEDYAAKGNLTNAKVGVKTDSHFIFRSIP
jgi:outer membrane protease